MTTDQGSTTIVTNAPITEDSRTMKVHDEVLTMKTLHAKGHSATKIASMLGCSHHTVLRYLRNDFVAAPRAQPPSVLDAHTDFLLERFLRHDGNADVVHQELVAELGINVSSRTVLDDIEMDRKTTPKWTGSAVLV